MTNSELEIRSAVYRKKILTYIKKANAGHTGGSLSCIDILNVLYNNILTISPLNFTNKNRNRYIQSKGHSVEALYVVLADLGFFPEKDLETLCQFKSHYVGHPTKKIKGIEQNTGALGHGLPISAGIALAAKKDQLNYKTYTLLGDGELAEGSNWEAAMFAAHNKLDNLVVIIDRNRLQITDSTINVCNSEPIAEKFKAFGWHVIEIDGHNIQELKTTFNAIPVSTGQPHLVIANTIKGKGVSFMENQVKWHHGVPSDEQYKIAMHELNQEIALLQLKLAIS